MDVTVFFDFMGSLLSIAWGFGQKVFYVFLFFFICNKILKIISDAHTKLTKKNNKDSLPSNIDENNNFKNKINKVKKIIEMPMFLSGALLFFIVVICLIFGLAYGTTSILVPLVFNILLYPLYLFSIVPYVPMTDFSWYIDLFFIAIILGLVAAYSCFFAYNKITKVIGVFIWLVAAILPATKLSGDFKNLLDNKENYLYVTAIERFKNTQFDSKDYSPNYAYSLKSSPFYKSLENEVKNPTLNSSILQEIRLFKRFQNSNSINYFLTQKEDKIFRSKYSKITNEKIKKEYDKIVSDGYISIVEKGLFEEKWKDKLNN